ncbi:PAS domain-containing protein [Halomonas halodenitrificans]|uniref:PAS domain-containing protein n=1 Tax=Halomonas halodenitrificans TaxID=28252 RepID=UPI000482C50B|nr:PAS domain-containing protein [Halomonas halodenitrificans]
MTDASHDNGHDHYQQLMQSRARSLFLHHPHAIFELDPQGRFRHANPAAGRFANLDENEGQGLHFSRFLESDDAAQVERHFQQAVAGRPGRCEVIINTLDGQRQQARLHLLPVAYGRHVTGVYVILEQPDAPPENAISPATRRLVEAMPVGVALLDTTRRDYPIRLCNPVLCQLLETPRDALEGHPLPLLSAHKDPAVRELQAALANRRAASQCLALTRHGKPLGIRLYLQPMAGESGESEASPPMLAVATPLETPFSLEG